jgi:hypothetical protein
MKGQTLSGNGTTRTPYHNRETLVVLFRRWISGPRQHGERPFAEPPSPNIDIQTGKTRGKCEPKAVATIANFTTIGHN